MSDRRHTDSRQNSTFSYHISPQKGAYDAATETVVAALVQKHRSSVRSHAKRMTRIEEALRARSAALDKIVGARTRRRLLDFSREQRTSSYGLTDFRPGAFNAAVLAEAKAAAQRKSLDMVRRARVDIEAVRKVHAAAARRIQRMTTPALASATELAVTPVDEVPIQALGGSTSGWFVRRPPYDGMYARTTLDKDGGSLAHHHNVEVLEDPFTSITGRFGHYSRYTNYDAGFIDGLFMDYWTGVGFWYNPPSPGKRDVWFKIRSETCRADVWLDNEYGMSDSWSHFYTRFTIDIEQLLGVEAETPYWHVYVEGDPDSKWFHLPMLAENAVIWIPLRVNFPPGAVFIWVGSHDARRCGLDDMSTAQTMQTKYCLEEVHIAE